MINYFEDVSLDHVWTQNHTRNIFEQSCACFILFSFVMLKSLVLVIYNASDVFVKLA